MVRAAVTHVPHARGVWRRSGDYATGWFSNAKPLRIVAPPPDVDVSFVYRRPGLLRVETSGFLYVDDGETAYLREPDGTVISAPSTRILLAGGPEKLLMAEIDTPMDRRRQATEATISEVELLGRRAWLAEARHGRFWVDDATGVLLRSEQGADAPGSPNSSSSTSTARSATPRWATTDSALRCRSRRGPRMTNRRLKNVPSYRPSRGGLSACGPT